MRLNLPERRSLFLLALTLSLLAGCGAAAGAREAALNERFKLGPGERVAVREARLIVQLKSVRRTWHVDGRGETADADLILTLGGATQRRWLKVGEQAEAGGYVVKLWGADPFGKTSAELIVTRR